jgi:phenylacetate-coenzyme A ligase PaaK-like adenylate-forming protein
MTPKELKELDFEQTTMETFRFQALRNPIYKKFLSLLGRSVEDVQNVDQIPFMPIQFFKEFQVKTTDFEPEKVFLSSGTTGSIQSKHLVKDLNWYDWSFREAFDYFYGPIEDYVVLALLPSYLERDGSSLIYMADDFIKRSKHKESGFYLNNRKELVENLNELEKSGKKTLLLGVSFALLDLVEEHPFSLKHTIVMETGGMKGRRKEMIREELHQVLASGFGVEHIHSEYGMTELLSQAYSKGKGIFQCPPWMKIKIRDTEDALTLLPTGKSGGINIIDLANRYSCSFLATQDLGRCIDEINFEVLGRFDNSDIRGCNLLIQ